MSIGAYCNRDVVIVHREESVLEAAKLMRHFHVGDVVVVSGDDDRRVPVGIVTDRDIVVELVAEQVDPNGVSIGGLMSEPVFTVNESEELLDAIAQMRGKGVRRAPVVSAEGVLVGIISMDDLLDVLAEALNGLTQLTGREQHRERDIRV